MESGCGRKVGRRPENTGQGKKFCVKFTQVAKGSHWRIFKKKMQNTIYILERSFELLGIL